MTNNQTANQQTIPSPGSQIVNSITNGKNVPIITVTGGVIILAFIGVVAYAIKKGFRTDMDFKKRTISFSAEPDVQIAFVESENNRLNSI